MKLKISVADIILFALGLLLFVGSFTFFAACGPKDDGSYMTCHWAQVMITALGALLSVISLAAAVIPDKKVKAGLDLAAALVAVLAALVPSTLISLCMMPDMHCRSVTQPVCLLVSSVTAIAAVASAVYNLKTASREK